MRPSFKLYRLTFHPHHASLAWELLERAPAQSSTGINGTDLAQMIAELAILRDAVTARSRDALYDADGAYLGTVRPTEKTPKRATLRIPISGDGPLYQRSVGGAGLPDDWGRKIALAIDGVLSKIPDLPQGTDVEGEQVRLAALPLLGLAVIVAGMAATAMGSIAAWRFFDPDVRSLALSVRQAARDYAARLRVLRETGTLPAPSPTELAAKKAIEGASSEDAKSGWLWGAGVAGGVLAVTLILGVLTRGK